MATGAPVTVNAAETNGSRWMAGGRAPARVEGRSCSLTMDDNRIFERGVRSGGATGPKSEYALSVHVLGFVDGEISATGALWRGCRAEVDRADLLRGGAGGTQVTLTAQPRRGRRSRGGVASAAGREYLYPDLDRDMGVTAGFAGAGGGGGGTGGGSGAPAWAVGTWTGTGSCATSTLTATSAGVATYSDTSLAQGTGTLDGTGKYAVTGVGSEGAKPFWHSGTWTQLSANTMHVSADLSYDGVNWITNGGINCDFDRLAAPPPVLSSFTASPASITAGQSTTLSWSVTGATSLSISGIGPVTGTSVVVSPAATTTYTLTATNASGTVSASTSVDVTAAPVPVASSLTFLTQPQTGVAGDIQPVIRVQVLDQFGAPFTDMLGTMPITLFRSDAGGMSTLMVQNAVNGEASFAGVVINQAGSGLTLIASASGYFLTHSAPFDVLPGPVSPAVSSVTSSPSTIEAGGSSVVGVTLRDAQGNPIAGLPVSLSTGGAGTIVQPGLTDVNGQTTGVVTLTAAGNYSLSVSSGATALDAVAVTVTPGAPSASRSTLSASPGSVPADGTPITLTTTLLDEYGNATGSYTAVTFSSSGAATFSPASVNTGASNVATTTVSSTVAGTQTIVALLGSQEVATATVGFTALYSVGGTISGYVGTGLMLSVTGQPSLSIVTGATSFQFPTGLPSGSGYSVTVAQQPTNPPRTCTVSNGTGVIGSGPVTNVAVTCAPAGTPSMTVVANISRLSGTGLVLSDNGVDLLPVAPVSAAVVTTATFQSLVPPNGAYVGVATQPLNQVCTVPSPAASSGSATTYWVDVVCNCAPGFVQSTTTCVPDSTTPGTFAPTGDMQAGRVEPSMTLLLDGTVLVLGGQSSSPASAERYDPVTGVFSATGNLATGRNNPGAARLPSGKVLIVGGYAVVGSSQVPMASSEIVPSIDWHVRSIGRDDDRQRSAIRRRSPEREGARGWRL